MSQVNNYLLMEIAEKAARLAGQKIKALQSDPLNFKFYEKKPKDWVTSIDHAVDAEIVDIIKTAFPEQSILTEERGLMPGNEYCWIIDPIDGTTNLMRGLPHYAISIAVKKNDVNVVGVIFDPVRDEMFTAVKDHGAKLNDKQLPRRTPKSLEGALIATGFPSKHLELLTAYQTSFAAIFPATVDIRRAGSAALDLAYVACGRHDGFWEFNLQPWDIAAAELMVTEVGGKISDLSGGKQYPEYGVIAGVPSVWQEIVELIKPIWQESLQTIFLGQNNWKD